MIERIAFGRTGHMSSRVLFGAAALAAMSQDRADRVLELLLEFGVNHIDTAAIYGESELRLAPWLGQHRQQFFVATKTVERTAAAARDQLHRSLDRLGVDQVDLIQLHNLVEPADCEVALGSGGALEALVDARDEGLVRFIGLTGHGTYVAARQVEMLQAFPFDSVLAPYNFSMMRQAEYSADFEALVELCHERGVALQTIKSIALRRWQSSDPGKRFSWYKPIEADDELRRAVHYVLARDGLFLNTSSDARLLRATLEAASLSIERPDDAALARDVTAIGIEPLFVRDVSDAL